MKAFEFRRSATDPQGVGMLWTPIVRIFWWDYRWPMPRWFAGFPVRWLLRVHAYWFVFIVSFGKNKR